MVCYARPVTFLAAILIVAWLAFSGPVSHFFSTAAVLVAVLVATAVAAVAAALVFATAMSARRRRSAAGGCTACRFRCQHAITGSHPFWLVTTADRRMPAAATTGPGGAGQPGPVPVRSVPVLLPLPTVRTEVSGVSGTTPRWPDRPLYRAARERAGSPA
jgi:hypothetical protein